MRETISDALKTAMKARDAERTAALRMISAAIKDRDIDARGKGRGQATGEELVATLLRMVKQRDESAGLYDDAGRPELADKERGEIAVIREFLPQQMDAGDLDTAVRAAIAETGAASLREIGRVMALLKERHAGTIDLGRASGAAKALLG